MADQNIRGPSTHNQPPDVTSAFEGLSHQTYQESASDADNFDFEKFLNQDSASLAEQYSNWLFDNELNNYLDHQNQPLEVPDSYLSGSPSKKRQKVDRNLSTPSFHRDELVVSAHKRQRPKTRRSTQKMVDELKRQRSFGCPYRIAQAKLNRLPYSCIGCQGKNMGEVRRHLTRPLRNKKPPHLPFLKLCPTCNEDFLDKTEFERDHGSEGEECTNPRKQRKGDEGQQQQWDALYSKVESYIMTDSGTSSDTALTLSPMSQPTHARNTSTTEHSGSSGRSRRSSYRGPAFETPDQGDIQHVGTWSDRPIDLSLPEDDHRSSMLHRNPGKHKGDGSRSSNGPRDLRMQMAHVVHQSSDDGSSTPSRIECGIRSVCSPEEVRTESLAEPMQIDGRISPCHWTYNHEPYSSYAASHANTITSMPYTYRPRPNLYYHDETLESPDGRYIHGTNLFRRPSFPISDLELLDSPVSAQERSHPVFSSTIPDAPWYFSVSSTLSADSEASTPASSTIAYQPSFSTSDALSCETSHYSEPIYHRMMMNSIATSRNPVHKSDGMSASQGVHTTSAFTSACPYPERNSSNIKRTIDQSSSSNSRLFVPEESPSPCASDVSVTPSNLEAVLECKECGKNYSGAYRRGNFQRHLRLKHGHIHGQEERMYPCKVAGCHKVFKRQDARLKHYRKQHPKEAPGPALPRRRVQTI